jgi:hypothetical protein
LGTRVRRRQRFGAFLLLLSPFLARIDLSLFTPSQATIGGPFASVFYTPFDKVRTEGQKPFIALVFKGSFTFLLRFVCVAATSSCEADLNSAMLFESAHSIDNASVIAINLSSLKNDLPNLDFAFSLTSLAGTGPSNFSEFLVDAVRLPPSSSCRGKLTFLALADDRSCWCRRLLWIWQRHCSPRVLY